MKMNSKLARLAMGVVVLGCTTTWQNCLAQTDDPLALVKELYGYSEWEGQTKEHYEQIVTNWVPDLGSMGITNFDVVDDREELTNFIPQKFSLINLYPPDAPTTHVQLPVTCKRFFDQVLQHFPNPGHLEMPSATDTLPSRL